MIDTLKFEIDNRHFDYNELHDLLYRKFQFEGKTTYKYGESIKFKYRNWLFWLTKNRLKASGSLNKLYHDNNLASFSFTEMKKSIDALYELLEFDISDAKIKQIDIGYNFKMSHDVNCYFDLLVPPTGFKPWKISNETLYLKKNDSTTEITFYDKGKETKSKYNHLVVDSPNLLRYELKIKKNIAEAIGDDSLVSLYKFDTYLKLVEVWHENYVSVPKITLPLSSKIQLASRKSLANWLLKEGIKANGGVEVILSTVANASLTKAKRHAMRKLLKSINEVEYLSPRLKEELDYCIEAVYHRQISCMSRGI